MSARPLTLPPGGDARATGGPVSVTLPADDWSSLANLLHEKAKRSTPERRARLLGIRRIIVDTCLPAWREAQ